LEATIFTALDLASDLYEAYRQASPKLRRLLNQAFFEHIWVNDDGVHGAVLTEHAAALIGPTLVEDAERVLPPPAPVFSSAGSNENRLVPRQDSNLRHTV
jgi:hypothetical protein